MFGPFAHIGSEGYLSHNKDPPRSIFPQAGRNSHKHVSLLPTRTQKHNRNQNSYHLYMIL